MKTIRLCFFCTLLVLTTLAKAQTTYLPDEIWYDSGEQIYVQFCLPSVYQINKYKDSEKLFGKFYALKLSDQAQKPNAKLSIELNEQKGQSVIRTSDDYIPTTIFPSELSGSGAENLQVLKLVTADGPIVWCYFDTTEHLTDFFQKKWNQSISSISDTVRSNLSVFRRKPMILIYQNKNGKIQQIAQNLNQQANYLDQLQLVASAGVNGFKTKLLPSFKLRAGLIFSRKGIYKDHYFAQLELLYDFASDNNQLKSKTGSFLDFGYKHNFSNNPEKENWYGFSVGYMSSGKSDIFDDNTWRLSVYRNLGKNIEIVPQLYFPDNFSSVFPGLSLHISF